MLVYDTVHLKNKMQDDNERTVTSDKLLCM